MSNRLPSWRPGPTRDAILEFLDGAGDVPIDERVAYVDNDGTMWCEKPTYVQFDFFVDALQQRTEHDPSVADRPEFAAVLSGDMAAIGEIGLAKVAGALDGAVRRTDAGAVRRRGRRVPRPLPSPHARRPGERGRLPADARADRRAARPSTSRWAS